MKIRICAVFLLLASIPITAAPRRRAVAPPGNSVVDARYLNAARAAAAWLESLERQGARGTVSWPTSESANGAATGIDLGAAGIGAFHLRLYVVTGEQRYLDKAIGAGAFVAESYAGGGGGVDWLGGRAGGGEYLLALYDVTGDPRWLDEAKRAAASLITAGRGDAETIYWLNGQSFTSLAHGAAGIGHFFLRLHRVAPDPQYIDVAMRASRWILQHTLPAGPNGGITIKRVTTDAAGYMGWCGGTVGTIIFFDELARVTGDAAVADARDAMLQGLLDTAVTEGEAGALLVAWRYSPTPRGSLPIIYCHGASSTAAVLARAFLRSSDVRYSNAARGASRWLDRVAIAEPHGKSWDHIEGSPYHELGLMTGTASVGHASLELHRAFLSPGDLDRAKAAAEYLLSMAVRPAEGQMKWITRTDTVGGNPRYETGWYMGAAGIGLFFLELHDAGRGDVRPREFSIFNP